MGVRALVLELNTETQRYNLEAAETLSSGQGAHLIAVLRLERFEPLALAGNLCLDRRPQA